jgi:hypothetical protein
LWCVCTAGEPLLKLGPDLKNLIFCRNTKFLSILERFRSTIPAIAPSWGGSRFSKKDKSKQPTSGGLGMDPSTTGVKSTEERPVRQKDRNIWIVTAFAVSGVLFFGVLAFLMAK